MAPSPSKAAAKQNSGTSTTNKYQRTAWRRKQRSLKKLKLQMKEIKVEIKKIRKEVDMISQGLKHLKGKRSNGKEKSGTEKLMYSTRHHATGEQGTKEAPAKKRQGLGVKFNKRLKKKKTTLLRMEAKAAEERAETRHMREEVAEMVEAIEEKEADLELLRMLNNQLSVDMVHMSEAEERLMESLLS